MSLTEDIRGIIYECDMFKLHATGVLASAKHFYLSLMFVSKLAKKHTSFSRLYRNYGERNLNDNQYNDTQQNDIQ